MTKYLLDTSVIIAGLTGTSKRSKRYYDDKTIKKCTIEYVIKEVYHIVNGAELDRKSRYTAWQYSRNRGPEGPIPLNVLKKSFDFSEDEINYAMEDIYLKIEILPNPNINEYKKIKIRDRSDRPIVCAAQKYNCRLLIRDFVTYQDSKDIIDVEYIPKNE